MLRFNIVLMVWLSLATTTYAQIQQHPLAADSSLKRSDSFSSSVRPYEQVITAKAQTFPGMFKVHLLNNHYYFEIPDSLFHRAILVVNRILKAAAGPRPLFTGYAGDEIAENVIRFEPAQDDRVLLKVMRFDERSTDSTDDGMYRAVLNSNLEPIAAAFPVKAYNKGAGTTVIDVTDFLGTENEIMHFSASTKAILKLGSLQADKSFIMGVKAFPINIEIQTLRSYTSTGGAPGAAPSSIPGTYELNSSMVLLPKVPMQPRYADQRVGFFARGFIDFDADPQAVKAQYLITRWRLEPKPEDVEKYKRGELVEPKQPIIYYIDPATPKKWVPYLIAGVNDWQHAFEQAGFKNAIKALPAPENDTTWSLDDARHNVLVYKPSQVPNASGPHVHDPRSGEIIEAHINWYHNVMQLLHNWYMIQAGAIDPAARNMHFSDSLMGQLIRFASSHEVGHTLGLTHNFGASSTIPVARLRDKAYVEAHGHSPSIMDYARFNYVAQPEDNITEKGIFPRIGEYDAWALEYGYRWYPQFKTPKEEVPYLNQLIIDSLSHNKRLYFGSENSSTDPRNQSEDLGDDAVLANGYGIKNLQRVLSQLPYWTREPNEDYANLKMMYEEVFRQYKLYIAQVLKIIGGEYHTAKSIEQSGPTIVPVEYAKQKAAMKFLNQHLFTTPDWLINDTLSSRCDVDPVSYILNVQNVVLMRLQGSGMLMTLLKNAELHKGTKTYKVDEYLEDLKQSVWSELYSNKPIDIYRRNLQKLYIGNAFHTFKSNNELVTRNLGNGTINYFNPDPTQNDASSIVRAHLIHLRNDIQKAIPQQTGISKYHLQDIQYRIDTVLKRRDI